MYALVEGPTELNFAKKTLVPHLAGLEVFLYPVLMTTKRSRRRGTHRGGLVRFSRFQADLKELRAGKGYEARFTSMIDLYGLPNDFPEFSEARAIQEPRRRVEQLEAALSRAINDSRFIPYIQLHEFEALLFAEVGKLGVFLPEYAQAIDGLIDELDGRDPESINDGAETAPSKRLTAAIPSYEDLKRTVGPQVAGAIGLETLRARCPHFGQWLGRLESLGET